MTGGVVVALIGATGLILAAVVTARVGSHKQLSEIHVLVNARLSEALEEITSLKAEISQMKKYK